MGWLKDRLSPRLIFLIVFIAATAVAAALLLRPQTLSFQNVSFQSEVAKPAEPEPLRILFGGDVFLDRSIRRAIEAHGQDFLWQNIESFLKSFPYKVINLEGPISNKAAAAPTGSFSFAFQENYIPKLKELGFTAVSLANNHTDNQGAAGLANSRTVLERLGLSYFGDPANNVDFCCTTLVYDQNGLQPELAYQGQGDKLALVGEHDLVASGLAAILQKIRDLDSRGYFIIVMPHWGPEYVLSIPEIEKNRAHALIDAGADLIIGAHPHVVQPIEVYKDRAIFYSLGNFLFDQWFSYDTLHGLLVEAEFADDYLRFKLYPTEQNREFQISLAPDEARARMLERLGQTSAVTPDLAEAIKSGEFVIARP